MHSGYSMVELAMIIALLGTMTAIAMTSHASIELVTHRTNAELAESNFYNLRLLAVHHRSDQWISVINNQIISSANWTHSIHHDTYSINSTGKLGFTQSGTTKYSGTLKIGSTHKLAIGANMGRPNISRQ